MNLDMFSLQGKTAIVTGANTGLGQGMCIALAEAGANVVGVARREMTETQKICEEKGAAFLPVIADLLTLEPIERILDEAEARFGAVDILVNNAGSSAYGFLASSFNLAIFFIEMLICPKAKK